VAVGEPAGAGGTPPATPAPASWRTWPLPAAGFLTAFGAHATAANLGRYATGHHASLLELGVLLALYDGAEVLLKPAFGALADRIGARPVLLGGLLGFAVASAGFVLAGEQDALAAARLAQGAAAAFSPAASALVARFSPAARRGRAFGSYGAWKGLGYTTGPLLGGGLITLGGFRLLFGALAALGLGVAAWAAMALPAAPPLPRARQTVLGLARRLAQPSFLQPVLALAGATAALSAGVGFLPVRGAQAGLGPLATGAAASLLALAAALIQPRAGRRRVRRRRGAARPAWPAARRGRRRHRHRPGHPARLRRPEHRHPDGPAWPDHGRRRGRP
jgi:DHA1 family tetracycline resistance protein-like MFS transporter